MRWGKKTAYSIGLIVADGSLSKDGRHIDFTSKDIDQIKTFRRVLKLKNKIGIKYSSYGKGNKYYRVQFGNIKFYKFLIKVGLMPNKSCKISSLQIPNIFFADFLRGYFDGDGCSYSYFDPRWKSSYCLYVSFASGSKNYLKWLKKEIKNNYQIDGKIDTNNTCSQLRFAKQSSLILIQKMYYKYNIPCLERKRSKIRQSLGIIDQLAGMSKLVYEHA